MNIISKLMGGSPTWGDVARANREAERLRAECEVLREELKGLREENDELRAQVQEHEDAEAEGPAD
jgi:hypothetical protein